MRRDVVSMVVSGLLSGMVGVVVVCWLGEPPTPSVDMVVLEALDAVVTPRLRR